MAFSTIRKEAIALLVLLLAMAASQSSLGYLNAPVEKLTLPELLVEFKSVEVVRAGRADLDKGIIIWRHVEQLQGKAAGEHIKHLVKLKGKSPARLQTLKPEQTAIFFSLDGFGRGLVLTEGCWYVVGYEAEGDCWRIAYTDLHYDFNTCFSGTPGQMEKAIRQLLDGHDAVVECRVKPGGKESQMVQYNMKRPKEKKVVGPATREAK